MAFPPHFSKDDIFYGNEWTRDSELQFVNDIEIEAVECRFRWPDNMAEAISRVINGLRESRGLLLNFGSCIQRLRLLRERFNVFYYIVNAPKVTWFEDDNTLAAPFDFWNSMLVTCPLSQAYVHEGEHLYYQLMVIFGLPTTTIQHPPTCQYSLSDLGITLQLGMSDSSTSAVGPPSIVEINASTFAANTSRAVTARGARTDKTVIPPTVPISPRMLFSPGASEGSTSVDSPSLQNSNAAKRLF